MTRQDFIDNGYLPLESCEVDYLRYLSNLDCKVLAFNKQINSVERISIEKTDNCFESLVYDEPTLFLENYEPIIDGIDYNTVPSLDVINHVFNDY